MHHRFDTILTELRQDLAGRLAPDSIRDACRQVGHRTRRCVLDPVAVVHWFVLQILHGNTSLENVARLGRGLFTGAAYCLARSALPLAVFQIVLIDLIKALIPTTHDQGLWRGHRTFLVDGSAFSMPDTPELQARFGQPGAQAPGCGFPVAKILALFHAGTGVLLKVMVTPLRSHEMASVEAIHPALEPGDVLVGDRGFCSYAHLAILVRGGIHAVFRIHQRQIVDFTPDRPGARPGSKRAAKGLPRSRWIGGLGRLDQVVEWFKPEERPGVDDGGAVRGLAGDPEGPRTALRGGPDGVSDQGGDPGHDAPGRRGLPVGGTGGARWVAMAGGVEFEALEDNDEDGCLEVQDG